MKTPSFGSKVKALMAAPGTFGVGEILTVLNVFIYAYMEAELVVQTDDYRVYRAPAHYFEEVEIIPVDKHKCHCPFLDLMTNGCRCSGI